MYAVKLRKIFALKKRLNRRYIFYYGTPKRIRIAVYTVKGLFLYLINLISLKISLKIVFLCNFAN